MKNFKKITAVALTLVMAAGLTACGGSAQAANKDSGDVKTVKVALAPGFYPITYADDNGEAAGYDVEVIKAIDELLPQYEFTFDIVEKETMNVGVETGTYQVGINSMFKTPERKEIYLFPETNMGYTAVGAISKEGGDKIHSFKDIYDRGLKLHPTNASGTIANVIADWNEANPDAPLDIEIVSNVDNNEALNAVRSGEYDAYIHLLPVINLWGEELISGLQISDPLDVVPTYPIINKDEAQLKDDINEALKKLKDDGTLSKISNDTFGYDVFELAK
ncbi:MAG: transporter substrate-binding domain-containing protein [Lachnospiraceae bacterium]|nr:transporter substrate-binding domain-containing protein [Lachnospiraceae bacterium]